MKKLELFLSILCAVLFVSTIVVIILDAMCIISGAYLLNMIVCSCSAIGFALTLHFQKIIKKEINLC